MILSPLQQFILSRTELSYNTINYNGKNFMSLHPHQQQHEISCLAFPTSRRVHPRRFDSNYITIALGKSSKVYDYCVPPDRSSICRRVHNKIPFVSLHFHNDSCLDSHNHQIHLHNSKSRVAMPSLLLGVDSLYSGACECGEPVSSSVASTDRTDIYSTILQAVTDLSSKLLANKTEEPASILRHHSASHRRAASRAAIRRRLADLSCVLSSISITGLDGRSAPSSVGCFHHTVLEIPTVYSTSMSVVPPSGSKNLDCPAYSRRGTRRLPTPTVVGYHSSILISHSCLPASNNTSSRTAQ